MARPKIASHIGIRAMRSAAIPDGIVCSAHATRPIPPSSRNVPTMAVSIAPRQFGRRMVRRLTNATAPASRMPAGTNRRKPITNGGIVSTATLIPR